MEKINMQKKKQVNNCLNYRYRFTIKWDVIFSLVTAILFVLPHVKQQLGVFDICYEYQKGFSKSSISIMELIKYLSFFVYCMYMNAIQYENEKKDYNILLKYRFKNNRIWNRLVQYAHRRYLVRYWFIYYSIHVFCAIILGKMKWLEQRNIKYYLQYDSISFREFGFIMVLSIFFSLLELFVFVQVLEFWHKLTNNISFAFICMFLTILLPLLLQVKEIKFAHFFGNASIYNLLELKKIYGLPQMVVDIICIYVIEILLFKFGMFIHVNVTKFRGAGLEC